MLEKPSKLTFYGEICMKSHLKVKNKTKNNLNKFLHFSLPVQGQALKVFHFLLGAKLKFNLVFCIQLIVLKTNTFKYL